MSASLVIDVPGGAVRGTSEHGATVFRGIPFAAAPLGDLRWRRPRLHPGWDGVREASTTPRAPIQPVAAVGPHVELSEDCLTTTVWVPEGLEPGESLPVLLWVYGGGFQAGYADDPFINGAALAMEQHMIVVGANHRVGALGFAELAHRGGPFAEASNLGLSDVAAALRWTESAIAAFGGDPASITVAGHSSGAFQVAALLADPDSRARMRAVGLMSGGASRLVPLPVAQSIGDRVVEAIAAAIGSTADADVATAPAEVILAAQDEAIATDIGERNGPAPRAFGVVLGGAGVSRHPFDVIMGGDASAVDMLVTTTAHEVAGLRPATGFARQDDLDLRRQLETFGVPAARVATIASAYAADDDDLTRESMLSDYIYRLPAARVARAHAATGGRVWQWETAESDSLGGRAPHGVELPLLFDSASVASDAVNRVLRLPQGEAAAKRAAHGRRLRDELGSLVRGAGCSWPATEQHGGATAVLIHDRVDIVDGRYDDVVAMWKEVLRP